MIQRIGLALLSTIEADRRISATPHRTASRRATRLI
jgi:hypothetical protein